MGTHEVLDLFELYCTKKPNVKFCKVCLKSENERPLVAPKNFCDLLKNSTGVANMFDEMHVCCVCEYKARAALKFLHCMNFAVVANKLFTFLKSNSCMLSTMRQTLKKASLAPNATVKIAVECEHLYQTTKRNALKRTDTLIIDTLKPSIISSCQQTSPDPDVIVIDDDEPPKPDNTQNNPLRITQNDTNKGNMIPNVIPVINSNQNQILMPVVPLNLPIVDNSIIIQNNNSDMVPILVAQPDGNYAIQKIHANQLNMSGNNQYITGKQINVNNLPQLNLTSANRVTIPVNDSNSNTRNIKTTNVQTKNIATNTSISTQYVKQNKEIMNVTPVNKINVRIDRDGIGNRIHSNVFTHRDEENNTLRPVVLIHTNSSDIKLIKDADGKYREAQPGEDPLSYVDLVQGPILITKTTSEDCELIVPDKKPVKRKNEDSIGLNPSTGDKLKNLGLKVVGPNEIQLKEEEDVVLLDYDSSDKVSKQPVASGSKIDWEDKIPMDVISFIDEEETWPGQDGLGIVADVRSER